MSSDDPFARLDGPTWTGLLDLELDSPVIGTGGPLRSDHVSARVLVRMHGAPVGFVSVPPQPEESLTQQVRAAAQAELSAALQNHMTCAGHPDELDSSDWATRLACPRRFPASVGVGVTVAIATKDRADRLRACLNAIQQIAYEPLEILVVDNAPTDSSTRDLVTKLASSDGRFTYACEPGRGASAARNLALAKARYELVALTDDDVVVDSGWVSALVAGFTSDPLTTCVTGFVAPSALDNAYQRYFEYRYPHQGSFMPVRYDLGPYTQHSPMYPFAAGLFGRGANMAVRREAALKVGGFDILLGAGARCRGGEDLDLFVRLLLDGGRISYVPSAVVWHSHREDADALRNAVYVYGFGLGAYLSKHLADPGLRHGLLTRAWRLGAPQVERARTAAQNSQLGARSTWLGLAEAYGVLAGAVGYRVIARQHSHLRS